VNEPPNPPETVWVVIALSGDFNTMLKAGFRRSKHGLWWRRFQDKHHALSAAAWLVDRQIHGVIKQRTDRQNAKQKPQDCRRKSH
jgi:hypothetical protein